MAGQAKQRQFIVAPTIRATEYKHGDNQTLIAHTVRSGGQGSPHGSKQNCDSYGLKDKIGNSSRAAVT
jgi:hypothetical protein